MCQWSTNKAALACQREVKVSRTVVSVSFHNAEVAIFLFVPSYNKQRVPVIGWHP